jgi:hypothetical protein
LGFGAVGNKITREMRSCVRTQVIRT